MNNDDKNLDPEFTDAPDDFKMGICVIGPNDDPFDTEPSIDNLLYDLAEGKHTKTEFRDDVIKQMMSVLISRDKPNCMLVGPAGCGKTKIVDVYCIIEIPNVANQKRTMLHDHFGYNCRIAS